MASFKLGTKTIGLEQPTYFVADISANHDGSLERAKLLIKLCADAGADAAKFQNFRAAKIVSARVFQTSADSCRTNRSGRRAYSRSTRTQRCRGSGRRN